MQRKVILVLGMHRSGTSALTRMLNLLGCDLPQMLVPSTSTNPTGHWEPNVLMTFNNEILQSGGSSWDDWLEFNPQWYDSPVVDSFLERGAEVLRAEYGVSPLFVLKDPRNCRLTRFWFDVFDREQIEPLVVIPLRNPLEVAASLEARDGIHRDLAMLLWLRHVLDAEQGSRGRLRIFATYEELLDQWTNLVDRMQAAFGIAWPRTTMLAGREIGAFLDPGNRHHVRSMHSLSADPTVSQWVREAGDILIGWAKAGEDRKDYAALDQIRQQLNSVGPVFMRLTRDYTEAQCHNGDLRTQLQTKNDELAWALGEISTLQEGRNQASAHAEGLAGQVKHWESQYYVLQSEQAAVMDELAQLRAHAGAVEALERKLAESQAELDRDRAAREVAESKLQSALDGHRAAETAFAAECEGLNRQLAESMASQGELDQERLDLAERLEMMGQELEKARVDLADRQHVLANVQSTLRQRDEEIHQTLVRLEVDRGLVAEAEAARAAAAEKALGDAMTKVADLEQGQDLDRLELVRLQREREDAEADAQHWRGALSEAAAHVQALTDIVQQREVELDKARSGAAEEQAQVAMQRAKVGELSILLQDREAELDRKAHQAEWLRQVHAVVTSYPRWWALMPKSWQEKQRRERLSRQALFDTNAYLDRYPDVASSGVDPLRHYILHGISENRSR